MTSQQGYFITYYPDSTTVTLANNSIVKAAGMGDVVLFLPSGDITLNDELHIQSLGFSSHLSIRLIHQSGCQIAFARQDQDHLVEISWELIMSCTSCMVLTSLQLRH
jgi:hypothetical protein